MRNYLNSVVNIGVDPNSSRIEQRDLILPNKISLLFLPIAIIVVAFSYFSGAFTTSIVYLVLLGSLLTVFGLNKLNFSLQSRITLSLFPPSALIIPFVIQESNLLNDYYPISFLYIGLVIIPLILFFRRSERFTLWTFLFLHLSILIFLNTKIGLTGIESLNLIIPQLLFWILLVTAVQFFKTESRIIQNHLQESNNALSKSNAEIKLQKEEIQTQNEFLNAKQLKIEEQSANLLKSNNELMNTKVELLKMIDRLEEAKENLKKKEAEAESILRALDKHYIVAQFDLKGKLVHINHKVTDLFGAFKPDFTKVKAIQNQDDQGIENGPKLGKLMNLWPEILKGNALSMDIEIPIGESSKFFSTTFAPLFDPKGIPYRVLAIGQDITELYDKKDKINTINEELKEKIYEISQQNELLNFQQLEIFNKNEELKSQAEEIRSINESLETRVKERTQVLEEKNKQLAEYAFINSHVLRAPVSTMIGLINLISYSALSSDDKKVYDHLMETANILDTIVYKINDAIDNGSHFDRNYLEPERDFHPMN